MKTPVFFTGSSSANLSTGATRYAPLAGSGSAGSTFVTSIAAAATPIAIDCVISTLRGRFPTALLQGSYTVTLMAGDTVAGITATALSFTISSAGIIASDLANSVSIDEGDYACWRFEPTGTPTAQTNSIQLSFVIDAVTPGESIIFATVLAGTTAGFVGPQGAASAAASEAVQTGVFPCPGTLSNLYSYVNNAPGTGNGRAVTPRKGTAIGGLSNQALTVSLGATDKVASDVANSFTVAEGDFVSIGHTITGTPASSSIMMSMKFVPTTAGYAPLFGMTGSLSTSATRYVQASGLNGTAESTEANVSQLIPADGTFKKLRADTTTAPGSAKTRTQTLRVNAANSGLVAAISGTGITATDTEDVDVAGGDLISISSVPASTPASSAWLGVSSVLVLDSAAPSVNFSDSDVDGQTFEGIRNTSKVLTGGSYSGTPTDVEVRLIDEDDEPVTSWESADVQTAGMYFHTFEGLPIGGPYRQQVRDDGGSITTSAHGLYVGAIIVLWGQSQCERLDTSHVNGLAASSGMQVRFVAYSSKTDVSSATTSIVKLTPATTSRGSAIVALANQWHADTGGSIPLLIVPTSYQGTSIGYWTDDKKGDHPTNADVTSLWGSSPTTGFAWFMANAARYQASAIVFMQGTSNTNYIDDSDDASHTYAEVMDILKAKFEDLYDGVAVQPLFAVLPHQRSDDGNNTWALRQVQYEKAVSGGNWRLLCWLLDWLLDGNGAAHQEPAAEGNVRGGTRIGRGLAKLLFDDELDIAGPGVVSCAFTDGARNAIKISFASDITLADGTAYAGSPVALVPQLFSISGDSGATFALPGVGITAAMTASNEVRITKSSGSWSAGVTRVSYLRGTPFGSDPATDDYVGAESAMEANYLSKVITDTSSFDGGRGMPLAPFMGTGLAVAEADPVAAEPAPRRALRLGWRR